jgi:hypothetical protein
VVEPRALPRSETHLSHPLLPPPPPPNLALRPPPQRQDHRVPRQHRPGPALISHGIALDGGVARLWRDGSASGESEAGVGELLL